MKHQITTMTLVWALTGLSGTGQVAYSESGSIVGWGSQVVGVDLSAGFEAVAAGGPHSLGLKADGSVVAWGWNGFGQTNVPAPTAISSPSRQATTTA